MKELIAKYSWKARTRILALVSALFGVCCYQLSIKKTLEVRKEYIMQRASREVASATEARIRILKKQTRGYETRDAISQDVPSEKEIIVRLADELQIVVKNLTQEASVRESGKEILYNAFYFSAPFIDLLMLLHRIERESVINILNVQFYNTPNQRLGSTELIMKVETAMIKDE